MRTTVTNDKMDFMKAIEVQAHGGPEVMTLTDVHEPAPGADEVVAEVAAIGVNFIDTYHRSGVYPTKLPLCPGLEGAGVVTAVGENVDWAKVGDRVAWNSAPGSYAEHVALTHDVTYAVPDEVPLETAAALMLQGLTAHYLATSSFELKEGHTSLVHAGAGGVGLLLTQLAKSRGARVITTVSSDAKEELSRGAGADEVLRYDRFADMTIDLPAAVKSLTGGIGADVVYDGVGAATFDGSLASVAVRGMLVLFGGASGQVEAFDLQRLNAGGSLSITRPSMGHFLRTDEERAWRSGELFAAVAAGELDVRIGATYPLAQAAQAHRALEGRETTGKVLLLP